MADMVDSGWADGDEGSGGVLSGDAGQSPNAAKAGFPSWDVEQVSEAPVAAEQVQAALPSQAAYVAAEEPRRRRPIALFAILGLAALIGMAAVGYWFGTRDAESNNAALLSTETDAEEDAEPESPVVADDADTADADIADAASVAADDNADSGGDDAGVDGEAADGEPVDSDYEAPDVDPGAAFGFESEGVDAEGRPVPVLPDVLYPNRENLDDLPFYSEDPIDAPDGPYTVIEAGYFFLRGALPSENARQELIKRNLVILPEEQMVVEYAVDPDIDWYFGDPIEVFLLDKLLFDVGSIEVNPAFMPLFEIGANLTQVDSRVTITVTGHTDSEGDDDFNLELSEGRVNAVRDVYISLGASPDQVVAVGKGESDPIADNATAEGRALNRRVEFTITSSEVDGADAG